MTGQHCKDECAKNAAALRAISDIESGMRLGLGTGSTAGLMIEHLGRLVAQENLDLCCTATSKRSAVLAQKCGLTVLALDEIGQLDLVIDGTDEFDPAFNLIKGGGGAHLREKIVAAASKKLRVIADPKKRVTHLGAFPLPVEVIQMGHQQTEQKIIRALNLLGYKTPKISLRGVGDCPFVTDEGNYIFDLALGRILNPAALDTALCLIPGVVETGLFLGLCTEIVLGYGDGRSEILFPANP